MRITWTRSLAVTLGMILMMGFVAQIFRIDFFQITDEKRKKSEFPRISDFSELKTFPSEYDRWFSDHFGLRNALVRANGLFKYYVPHTSSSPDVFFGLNDHLFYKSDFSNESARHANPWSNEELNRITSVLLRRTDVLKAQGITYVILIPPDAQSIYPEDLPSWMQKKVSAQSRLDQLVKIARENQSINLVDLRSRLLREKAKGEFPLYYQTNSHWNAYGAYIGYHELMMQVVGLASKLALKGEFAVPAPISEFTVASGPSEGGDLAQLLGLVSFLRDTRVPIVPKSGPPLEETDDQDFVTEQPPGMNLPRAVIFRDSFFTAVQPHFSRHFSKARFIWRRFDYSAVKNSGVQWVIDEHIERSLNRPLFETLDIPDEELGHAPRTR